MSIKIRYLDPRKALDTSLPLTLTEAHLCWMDMSKVCRSLANAQLNLTKQNVVLPKLEKLLAHKNGEGFAELFAQWTRVVDEPRDLLLHPPTINNCQEDYSWALNIANQAMNAKDEDKFPAAQTNHQSEMYKFINSPYFQVSPAEYTSQPYTTFAARHLKPFKALGFIEWVRCLRQFVRNPTAILKEMEIFETYLQHELGVNPLQNSPAPEPAYTFAAAGFFLPGPPADPNYQPLMKEQIIERMLSHFETRYGINLKDLAGNDIKQAVPIIFEGIVRDMPPQFFHHKKMFKEDIDYGRAILHGKNSHRLLLILLCSHTRKFYEHNLEKSLIKELFFKNDPLSDIKYLFMEKPTPPVPTDITIGNAVYSLLMIRLDYEIHLWSHLIDFFIDMKHENTVRDTVRRQCQYGSKSMLDEWQSWIEQYFTPVQPSHLELAYWNNYSFSSQNPFVFNSILLCFTQPTLPLLNMVVLDSFWKSMYRIAYRLGCELGKQNTININALYEQALLYLAVENTTPGGDFKSSLLGMKSVMDPDWREKIPSFWTSDEPKPYHGFQERYKNWSDYLRKKLSLVTH